MIMPLDTEAYYPYEKYAYLLEPLRKQWKVIRDEYKSIQHKVYSMDDDRNYKNSWFYIPLVVEDEDLPELPKDAEGASSAPLTSAFCRAIPNVEAYSFSMVNAGGAILPHNHDNRFVSCILTLQSGIDTYITVEGERREFIEGEFVIFDYRKTHSVQNKSLVDRIVLLVLLPI